VKYILLTMAILAAVLVVVGLRRALRTYLKFRGKRLVSCPETHQAATVRVAAGKAALEATAGNQELRLSECSRWPERGNCPQGCLAQIEEAPKACLVVLTSCLSRELPLKLAQIPRKSRTRHTLTLHIVPC
jgi:hypothetical protein